MKEYIEINYEDGMDFIIVPNQTYVKLHNDFLTRSHYFIKEWNQFEKEHGLCLPEMKSEIRSFELVFKMINLITDEYDAYVSELGDVLWHIALYYDATEIFRDKGVSDPLNDFIHKSSFIGLMSGLDNEHLRVVLQKYGYQYLVNDFKHNGHLSNVIDLLLEKSARALDAFKKHYFYKQELDHRHVVVMSNLCVDILKWIIMTSYLETEVTVYTLKEIMEANIKKLKARYAEKFTTEESENRDYEKESEAAGMAVK